MAKILIKDTIASLLSFYIPKMQENYMEELTFTINDDKGMGSYDFKINSFKANCCSYFVISTDFDNTADIRQSIVIEYSECLDMNNFINEVIAFINRETDFDHNKTTIFNNEDSIMIHVDGYLDDFVDHDETLIVDKHRITHNY
jgi:hypothetical protein